MKSYKDHSKMLFLVLLLVAFIGGCGKDHNAAPAAPSSAKAITVYSIAGVAGTIDETAKTISVTLPDGTNKTQLIATFVTTGSIVTVGTTTPVLQTSGTTTNNFTGGSVIYKVTAANGTTANYTVTVSTSLNTYKAITSYSIGNVLGSINKAARTISVVMPASTGSLNPLTATFVRTGTGVVTVGTTTQTSGSTPNNFTSPVAYKVFAADSSFATYTVTVTKAAADAKAITAFSILGSAGTITQGTDPKTIAVTVPNGTDVTALVATFVFTGESVTVGATPQVSGTTANNFSSPVTYMVTAADFSTATYIVTVTVAVTAGPAPVDLGTSGNSFAILAKAGISTTGTTHVTGDIGVSPAAATYITGFALTAHSSNEYSTSDLVTGRVYAANYAVPTPEKMTTAISDMETAFTDAAGRALPNATELYDGDISGRTLAPGLYKWSTGVLVTGVGVTLDALGDVNAVWIFEIAQNLTVSNGAIITLSGGAQAKNIFWQVSGQTTLGTTVDFKGNILCQTLISLNTGAVVKGRLLSQTAVTLDAAAVTLP